MIGSGGYGAIVGVAIGLIGLLFLLVRAFRRTGFELIFESAFKRDLGIALLGVAALAGIGAGVFSYIDVYVRTDRPSSPVDGLDGLDGRDVGTEPSSTTAIDDIDLKNGVHSGASSTAEDCIEALDSDLEQYMDRGQLESLCETGAEGIDRAVRKAEEEAPDRDPLCHGWADRATKGDRGSEYESEYELCMAGE
mgnify:CR=1 FL=1